MPSSPSTVAPLIGRRRLLVGCGLFAALAVATSGCGSPPPPAVDDLEHQLTLAQRDAALAAAAGATAPSATAAALTEIGKERTEHARALRTEIDRVTGRAEPGPAETSAPAAADPAAADPVATVVDALRETADSAGQAAAQAAGYRAGLLASIAAACTVAHSVTLAPAP